MMSPTETALPSRAAAIASVHLCCYARGAVPEQVTRREEGTMQAGSQYR